MRRFLLLAVTASVCRASWRVPLPPQVLHGNARSAARVRSKISRWAPAPDPPVGSRVFSPIDYGGDASGTRDSTAAVSAAVDALVAACAPWPEHTLGYVLDCGGATLDLDGGAFLISAPLAIPPNVGNLRVGRGTLRATPSFPRDRYLIEVGNHTGGPGTVVDIELSGLFLDALQVAAGCIHTEDVEGGVIGPQVYAYNFTTAGMTLNRGFELTVMQSWVGEFWFSDRRKENGTASTALGIDKNSNDGDVIDVVVFSSRIGLVVNGEANWISAVHTWNLADANGGIGILVNRSQVRLDGNYLDWNDVVFATSERITFTNGIFLCGARIRLEAPPGGVASSLYIAGNEYIGSYCHFSWYHTVQADGAFTSAQDVTVVGTLAEPMISVRSTTATRVVTAVTPTTLFTANFTEALIFDPNVVAIESVTFSLTVADGGSVVAAVARPPSGGTVTVETASAVAGTMVISVDQSKRRAGA